MREVKNQQEKHSMKPIIRTKHQYKCNHSRVVWYRNSAFRKQENEKKHKKPNPKQVNQKV